MKKNVTVWADRTVSGISETVGPLGNNQTVIGPGDYRGTIYDYYRGLGYSIREKTEYTVTRERLVEGEPK